MHPEERKAVMRNTFSPLQLGPAAGAYARQTIHGMLEHWAAATPDAPAATFQVCLQSGCIRVLAVLTSKVTAEMLL